MAEVTQWRDPEGVNHYSVTITDNDYANMTKQQLAMLQDGDLLIRAALNGDTEPKFLPSMGVMSHEIDATTAPDRRVP